MINLTYEIGQFEILTNFQNFTISEINILQFKKIFKILGVQIISEK